MSVTLHSLQSRLLLRRTSGGADAAGPPTARERNPLDAIQRHDARHMPMRDRHLLRLDQSVIDVATWLDAPLEIGDVSVRRMLTAAHGVVRSVAEQKPLAFDFRSGGVDAGHMIHVDASLTHAILMELLVNAVACSPPGGAIQLRSIAVGAQIWIRVSDEGPGIAAGVWSGARWSPSPGTSSFSRFQDGAGIGLANSLRAARSLGGELFVNRTGPGTTFTLALPRGRGPRS